jgi:hypothetical protein
MFADNAKELDASNKIVFLGDTKPAKARRLASVKKFDEHGMEYGWIENDCFVNVKHSERSDLEDFIEGVVDWLTGDAEKIRNDKYMRVICEFVFNGLAAFMENQKGIA